MRTARGRGVRGRLSLWLLAAGFAVGTAAASAQTLPIKERPQAVSVACASAEMPVCTASPGEVDDLVRAATRSLVLGNLEEAKTLLDRALAIDPCAAEAAYLQGRVVDQQEGPEAAARWFCRYVHLEPAGGSAGEARARLEKAVDAGVGARTRALFTEAVSQVRADRLERAEELFTDVLAIGPVPEAFYNRGLVRLARGRGARAREDLDRYLSLRPTAEDRLDIEFALQERGRATGPRPLAALALGALLPGAGQYYTGRVGLGLAVTGLVAGAVTAGYLYERTTVWCRAPAPSGDCPPDAVAGTETERPLLVPTVLAGVGVMLGGAIEAALHARRVPSIGIRVGTSGTLQLDVAVAPGAGDSADLRLLSFVHGGPP